MSSVLKEPTVSQRGDDDPYAVPIEQVDVSRPERFVDGTHWAFFERLRNEAPVHYCPESENGPYWSVTKYKDIMHVDTHHDVFSSEGGITIGDDFISDVSPCRSR